MYVLIADEGISNIETLADIPVKYDGAFSMELHGRVLFARYTKPCDRVIENYRNMLGWYWVKRP